MSAKGNPDIRRHEALFRAKPTDLYVSGRLEYLRILAAVSGDDNLNALRTSYLKQEGKCAYCRCNMWLEVLPNANCGYAATKDHAVPKCRGGKGLKNYVCACGYCNQLKDSLTGDEYVSLFKLPSAEATAKEDGPFSALRALVPNLSNGGA